MGTHACGQTSTTTDTRAGVGAQVAVSGPMLPYRDHGAAVVRDAPRAIGEFDSNLDGPDRGFVYDDVSVHGHRGTSREIEANGTVRGLSLRWRPAP